MTDTPPAPQVIASLASSLERRDEAPNVELAKRIANANDHNAVVELVGALGSPQGAIRSDCIKVLYEIGSLQPKLISPHVAVFFDLLEKKDNRLRWGAMTALEAIVEIEPEVIFDHLPQLTNAAVTGSVITNDKYVGILIKLCALVDYRPVTFSLLIEQLRRCPRNQLPMYAERAIPIVESQGRDVFTQTLRNRLADVPQESKRRRIEKVLRTVELSS